MELQSISGGGELPKLFGCYEDYTPENMRDYLEGQKKMLIYFIGVAQETKGAEIWRTAFASEYHHVEARLKALAVPGTAI
jgi:hypothetical protein